LNNKLFGILVLTIFSLFSLSGIASAACTDGETICLDEYKQGTCLNNEYSQVTVCNIVWGCDASLQACRYCNEGSTGCEGDYEWACTDGIREKTFCQFGCNPATNACYPSDPEGEFCSPEGITECTSNDNNGGYYRECTSATWQEGLYCQYNCDLSTNSCYECDNSEAPFCSDATTSRACEGTFYKGGYYADTNCGAAGCNPTTGLCNSPVPACTDGEQQCNSTVRQLCTAGAWGDIIDCAPDTCVQVNATSTICQAPPTCTDGEMQCNATMRQLCTAGAWGDVPPDCSATGEICIQASPTSAVCLPLSGCPLGDEVCIGAQVWDCIASGNSTVWAYDYTCASGTICTESAGVAICMSIPTTVIIGGSSQVGGVYDNSGGGEVSRCTQFTDWSADSSIEYVQIGADGSTRDCANTTLVRYCKDGGKINYYDYEKKPTVDCGDWSDKCDYVYTKTLQYDESEGSLCRSCQKDVYTYACQPSGKIYADNVKESAKCEEWVPCTDEEKVQARSGLDALLEDYGLFLGLILILLILAVAYTAYKMVDEEPGEEEGFGKSEEEGFGKSEPGI